ncbi:MAG TPA: thiol reductant ABC exporter subunit CydD [Actinomycetota bacterium]|nr:thiol reductant ABC exporter subunit CydD [Actinomycetota bacterium]
MRLAVILQVIGALAWFGVLACLAASIAAAFVDGADRDDLTWLGVTALGLILVRAAAVAVAEPVLQAGGGALRHDVRARLAAAMTASGPVWARGARGGELVYALGEGADALETALVRFDPARTLAVAIPLIVAVAVAWVDPWSVVVLLFAGPVLVAILGLIGRRVRGLSERRERELAWLHAHILDMIRGLPTLRMFGRSGEQAATIEELSAGYARSSMDVLRVAFQSTLVLEWGATAATAMVAIETSVRVMGGDLAFGPALLVLLLTPEFFLPLRRLSAEYHAGTAGDAAASRIVRLLDGATARSPSGGSVRRAPVPPAIRFTDVVVAYDDGRRVALDGCSFAIEPGEHVALVGPTGAGKSTIASALLGFVAPGSGDITVDGTPLATLELDGWRRQVAWVPQHPTIFHGTVADNLRFADPDADDDRLRWAAEATGAARFIAALPDGYATLVGEGGVRLSGGQRQLLALTRACVREAPLVVWDEPVSHLDDEVHGGVIGAVEGLLAGRTAIVITHGAAIGPAVDRVVELRAGRVVRRDRPVAPVGGAR